MKRKRRKNPIWILLLFASAMFSMIALAVWLVAENKARQTMPSQSAASNTLATSASAGSKRLSDPQNIMPSFPSSHSGESLALDMPKGLQTLPEYEEDWMDRPFQSDSPVHAHNSIDDIVFANLIKLKIEPAKLCSDEAFVRRIYIDALGTLPKADEAKRFLDATDPDKRVKLIDEVLQRPEYVDYMTMKWCDILRVKAEFPINLWPNAAQAYHHWIHESIKTNRPYDEFAFELLTSSGSNFRTPQVNFYRAMQSKEPEAIAQTVALTFLCERAQKWPQERLAGMAAFFEKVGYKPTGEWKEEIIFFDPRRGENVSPNEPVNAVYPNGVKVVVPAGEDPRRVFAKWLTHEKNPWFARAAANRMWYWLMGHGIVDPPDDVGAENPASNLELLNHLASELIASDFNMRHLHKLIFNSSAYQLSCIPQSDDPDAGKHFAYYHPRRQDAEVLIDAICQLTGTTETYMSIIPEPFTFLPDFQRAIALPDGSITSSFLETFGRPARDSGMEMERNNRLTAGQALHLLNSNHIRDKLKKGPGIKELLSQATTPSETAELLYLAILSRRPYENEITTAEQLCQSHWGTRDLAWALVNTDEFLFRH
ncbi:hypothetical protein CA13_04590 [Planctomycetes bacterium CA13]|uniref:DUF1553 domain-containing protein n=1 Tax=Novipirellula herctigrandis TaxID=2527986 RepID=A0A5C5YVI7_9BACT|nr:hypothetical protein CA13_04590 [Planctomycetes bacterium CA13]